MRRTHGYRCVPNAIKIVCFDFLHSRRRNAGRRQSECGCYDSGEDCSDIPNAGPVFGARQHRMRSLRVSGIVFHATKFYATIIKFCRLRRRNRTYICTPWGRPAVLGQYFCLDTTLSSNPYFEAYMLQVPNSRAANRLQQYQHRYPFRCSWCASVSTLFCMC